MNYYRFMTEIILRSGIEVAEEPEDIEEFRYNPGLTADLQTARYLIPGSEKRAAALIARGVNVAELIVSSIIKREQKLPDIEAETGEIIADLVVPGDRPKSADYFDELEEIARQLSGLLTLQDAPFVTPNDWGEVLKCEAWYRAEMHG